MQYGKLSPVIVDLNEALWLLAHTMQDSSFRYTGTNTNPHTRSMLRRWLLQIVMLWLWLLNLELYLLRFNERFITFKWHLTTCALCFVHHHCHQRLCISNVLFFTIIIKPHCIQKMRAIATDGVAWWVCLSVCHLWALQKQLNQSRCRLGGWLMDPRY